MDVKFYNNGFVKFTKANKIIKSRNFPAYFKAASSLKYGLFIGLGGNIGDVRLRFERFLKLLVCDRRFEVIESSIILKNAAFGYTNQDDFLNAVLFCRTNLGAKETLKIMLNYEKKFGRKRSFANAPRTLDLDMLYYEGRNLNTKRLVLPHPGASSRVSVIFPLGSMKSI